MLVCLCVLVGACKDGEDSSSVETKAGVPAEIVLAHDEIEIKKYESYALSYTVRDIYGDKITGAEVNITSSNTDVVTVENGALRAYAVGSADVTFTCGEVVKTARATVVANTMIPVLTLNKTQVETYAGGTLSVVPTVTFNGVEVASNCTFKTSNENVATVSETGEVRGVALGETTLNVTATYMGEELVCSIPVRVKELISLSVENASAQIYTSSLNGGVTGFTCTPRVYRNAQEIANPQVRYFESDETGAEITASGMISVGEDGKVQALKKGVTYVCFEWSDGAKSYVSTPHKVQIITPVVELAQTTLTIDLNGTDEVRFSQLVADLQLGDKTVEDVSILDGEEENFLTMTSTAAKGLSYGESVLIVYNSDGYAHKVAAEAYTKIISSAADLDRTSEILEANKKPTVTYKDDQLYESDGYFVLTQNIDYGGNKFDNKFKVAQVREQYANGFSGTFDGRGYAITNIQIWNNSKTTGKSGGLFGAISEDGVVKNLHIEASFYVSGAANGNCGVFGYSLAGTLQDVSVTIMDDDTMVASHGLFATAIESTAVLERIFVKTNMTVEAGRWNGNAGWLAGYLNKGVKAKHVYIVHADDGYDASNADSKTQLVYTYFAIEGRNTHYVNALTAEETVYGAYFASLADFKNGKQTKVNSIKQETAELPEGASYVHTVDSKYYAVTVEKSDYTIDYTEFNKALWKLDGETPYVCRAAV